jgi:hypothetical protein
MNEKSFETSADFLYGSISFGSGYLYEGKYIENEFDNISHVIDSVRLFAYKCVTYLSDIVVIRHLILANKSFVFSVFNTLELSLILHSPQIPPHLFNEIPNINTSLQQFILSFMSNRIYLNSLMRQIVIYMRNIFLT